MTTLNDDSLKTIDGAIQYAARMGIEVPTDILIKAQQAGEIRAQQVEATENAVSVNKGQLGLFVERFNRLYPKFLKALMGIGDVLITAVHTILIAFGVPIVLLMLMIVEQQRVYYGGLLFEVHDGLAQFGAWVLVIGNLLFELVIHWEEHRLGYTEPPHHEFSLRLTWQRFAYAIGLSPQWQARPKSPAQRSKIVLRFITITILTLALAGSMKTAIENAGGSWWGESLNFILTRSSLLSMATWIGGLMFAFTAVYAAQALSQYVAKKVVEIVSIMNSTIDDKPRAIAETVGIAGASVILAFVKDMQAQKRIAQRSGALGADMPSGQTWNAINVRNSSERFTDSKTSEPLIVVPTVQTNLSPMIKKAVQWLDDNPDKADLSIQKRANLAGVSKTTMNTAIGLKKGTNAIH